MADETDREDDDDFDEEDSGAEESAEDGKKKRPNRKKLLLLVVLPLLLIVGIAAGAYFTGLTDRLTAMFGDDDEFEMAARPAQVQAAVFYDLPEMLVNLNTPGRTQSFLKIRVSLEVASSEDVRRLEAVMPRIVDNFQVYLRELRVEDLQGAAGMYRLREELLARVNAAAEPAQVNDVLFREMLVQ